MTKTYEDGIVEGEVRAMKEILTKHDQRLDSQLKRILILEKLAYGVMGAFVLVEFYPTLKNFFGG